MRHDVLRILFRCGVVRCCSLIVSNTIITFEVHDFSLVFPWKRKKLTRERVLVVNSLSGSLHLRWIACITTELLYFFEHEADILNLSTFDRIKCQMVCLPLILTLPANRKSKQHISSFSMS